MVSEDVPAEEEPIVAGCLLDDSTFGWSLVIGGTIKAAYDLLLLRQFGDVRPR